MNYKIKREISPDELYHAKEGEERENHKYIARVLLKKVNVGGKKKNRYRYFYDKKSYQAYLNSKKSKESKNNFEKTKNSVMIFFDKLKSDIKEATSNDITKNKNTKKSTELILKENSTKTIGEIKSSYESNSTLKDAVSLLIGGVAGYVVNKLFNTSDEKKVKLPNGEHKTFDNNDEKKVKLPNGEYKTFDNNDEYEDYRERLKYQQNEPEFMKQIPDISENDVFTAMEDMSKVNELYDPYTQEYSTNCTNCSAAYELRRRGYDVEAKSAYEYFNGNVYRLYDYFENPESMSINEEGNTVMYSEEFWDDYSIYTMYTMLKPDVVYDKSKFEEQYKATEAKNSYTPESIEKAIKQHNPPGSRGMIDVFWNEGGAHSIVYEVNTKGDITIRDSQTYDEYSLDELAHKVNNITITRTDNLQLKEGILDAVKANKDEKRSYYINENALINFTNGDMIKQY